MKADQKEFRTLSSTPRQGNRKQKGLAFFLSVFFSLLFHLAVMAAVVYGVGGIGDKPRVVTLEITFVEDSINSPTPSPQKDKIAEQQDKKTEKPSEETKLAMNDEALPVSPPKKPEKPDKKEPVVESKPVQGTAQSSVIPLIKDIKKRIQVSPKYPQLAIRRGYEGTVVIHALVNRKGTIDRMKIVSSSGYPILDEAATTAVGQWEFDMQTPLYPKIWVEVPIRFVLNEQYK